MAVIMAESNERWPNITEVPDRCSFVPNTERNEFLLTTRAAAVTDYDLVRRVYKLAGVRASKSAILKRITQHGFTTRLTTRSQRYVVCGCVSSHWPDTNWNKIEAFWVHPEYKDTKVPLHLLQLARLELPEYATTMSVASGDTVLKTVLLSAGWTEISEHDNDSARLEYCVRSAAGREHSAALEKSRIVRKAPANG